MFAVYGDDDGTDVDLYDGLELSNQDALGVMLADVARTASKELGWDVEATREIFNRLLDNPDVPITRRYGHLGVVDSK